MAAQAQRPDVPSRPAIERSPTGGVTVMRTLDDVIVAIDGIGTERILDPVNSITVDGQLTLGVTLTDSPLGCEVTSVQEGLAGDRAGLIRGDKIVQIDEADIETPRDIQDAIGNHPPGELMRLVYIRNNKRYEREIKFVAPAADVTPAVPGAATTAEITRLRREVQLLRRDVLVLRDAMAVLVNRQLRQLERR
ncbi:PDZ domain-containing protein [Stieleria sp. TO1_6]|uniref:PDZ domain-containing protein n=1 Tax=Stieleria tagensis TaxID=2956795 RepID=UPI00209AB913|nr:PDZ domain-containing protein [Stieleria tagensis]MCO8124690.1 PDZ domain-containing protein [Stieleria tagensis]